MYYGLWSPLDMSVPWELGHTFFATLLLPDFAIHC